MSDRLVHIPAEWCPQRTAWCGWPSHEHLWEDDTEGARRETAAFVQTLAKYTSVKLGVATDEAGEIAETLLDDAATIIRIPMGDIWFRDTGPLFARVEGEARALTFNFNGWGGKYILPGDTETAQAIFEAEECEPIVHDFILEGGAVEFNGEDAILTTRQCLLNPNRNKNWNERKAEAALRNAFSAEHIVWLGDGIINDHTDGHVDNIARFAGKNLAVCQEPADNHDPNADVLRAIESTLHKQGFDVATLPSPGLRKDEDGNPVPASHMNWLVSNGAVIFPVYEDKHAARAETVLQTVFPDHDIIGLPADHILSGGGSFHCMTQQVPNFDEIQQ